MDKDLQEIINNCRKQKDGVSTMGSFNITTFYGPNMTHNIHSSKIGSFWANYCLTISTDGRKYNTSVCGNIASRDFIEYLNKNGKLYTENPRASAGAFIGADAAATTTLFFPSSGSEQNTPRSSAGSVSASPYSTPRASASQWSPYSSSRNSSANLHSPRISSRSLFSLSNQEMRLSADLRRSASPVLTLVQHITPSNYHQKSIKRNFCIGENCREDMPAMFEFTFKFQHKEDAKWNDTFLLLLVKTYQDTLFELLEISHESSLACVILRTEETFSPTEEITLLKCRLQFSYCVVNADFQCSEIRNKLIYNLRKNKVISYLPMVIGDWLEICDILFLKDSIPLYFSTKGPREPKMVFYKIFRWIKNFEEEFSGRMSLSSGLIGINGFGEQQETNTILYPSEINLENTDIFSFTNHPHVQSQYLPQSIFSFPDQKTSRLFWLPLFLSILYWPSITRPKADSILQNTNFLIQKPHSYGRFGSSSAEASSSANSSSRERISAASTNDTAMDNPNPSQMAVQLIQMISPKRVREEEKWKDIGKALYNCFKGSKDGLDLWYKYTSQEIDRTSSQRYASNSGEIAQPIIHEANIDDMWNLKGSTRRDFEYCKFLYYTFNLKNYFTEKTLAFFARKDSPDAYEEWHENWISPTVLASLDANAKGCGIAGNMPVAKCFYRCFWLEFIYDAEEEIWYYFNGVKLDKQAKKKPPKLRQVMSEDFQRVFERFQSIISDNIYANKDPDIKKRGQAKMESLAKILQTFSNKEKIDGYIDAATTYFSYMDLFNILDKNMRTMGMLDCVLEVLDTKVVFRDGKPEDFITKNMLISRPEDMSWEHPAVKMTLKYLSQILPDKELCRFALKIWASTLEGGNVRRLIVFLTGIGANSKSTVKKLFKLTFGPYFGNLPPSELAEVKMGGNDRGPTPFLVALKTAHTSWTDEPSKARPLEAEKAKTYSGGDEFPARGCSSNGGDIEPMFTMFILVNSPPKFNDAEKAMQDRVLMIPFLSRFDYEAPEKEDEQFKKRHFKADPHLKNKLPHMAQAFLWILQQYYEIYANEGLEVPRIVKDVTRNYWESNDDYQLYINENIQKALYLTRRSDFNPAVHPPEDEYIQNVDTNSIITLGEVYSDFVIWFKQTNPGRFVPDRKNAQMAFENRLGKMNDGVWRGYRKISLTAPGAGGGFPNG